MNFVKKINNEEIKEKFEILRQKILKSKITKILLGACFLLALLLFFAPFLLNNSQLKFQIEQKISKVYLANFVINGDVEIAFLPIPTIVAKDVVLRNYRPKIDEFLESEEVYDFYAKEVKIESSFFSPSKIESVSFIDSNLESYNSLNPPLERSKEFSKDSIFKNEPSKSKGSGFSSKIFSIEKSNVNFDKIPNFIVKNGKISIYDKILRKQQFDKINLNASFLDGKNVIYGNFISANSANNFKFISKFNSASKKPTSIFEVSSPVLKLSLKGNFTSENRGFLLSDFKGKVEAEIFDLKLFYKNYISAESLIHNKLRHSSDSIKISANVNNDAGEITFDNLIINSSLISGKGLVDLNVSKKFPIVDVDLDLDNIDFDNIWSKDSLPEEIINYAKNQQKQSEKEKAAKESAIFDKNGVITQVKDIDLSADIGIKNLKYLDGEIKDVSLYLSSSKQGETLILPAIFKVPGGGSFWVRGVFDNNSLIPKFIGKVRAGGEDLGEIFNWFKFEAQNLKFSNLKQYKTHFEVLLTPNKIALNNLYLNLNDGKSEFVGEIDSELVGKISNITSKFTISDFRVDDYFLTSAQSSYLSPGLLIKKMLWLNNINIDNDISLRFYKLSYRGEDFFDQNVNFKIGRGRFLIDDLRLRSRQTDLNLTLNVDVGSNNPRFDLIAKANNFHYDSSYGFQNLKGDEKRQNFFDRFYALPSLEGFDGRIAFDFENLKLDNFDMKYVRLDGKIKDGAVNISKISGEVYGGSFNYKGLIGIKINKIISGNLNLKNISLQPMMVDLFDIKNVLGVASVSSSLISSANKKDDFLKTLSGSTKFVVNSPIISGYGLNDLVKKMFAKEYYQDELNDPEKILFNPVSASVFKEARGVIQLTGNGIAKIRTDILSPAANGVLSGDIKLDDKKIDSLFNVIFLSGTAQKQIPINIATNVKGELSNPSFNTNFDQVFQYLGFKSVKLNSQETPLNQ